MRPDEERAISLIAKLIDPDQVRSVGRKAIGKFPSVEQAAIQRLVELHTNKGAGSVESDCWAMVLAVEEIRRHVRGRKSPMNRLRPKIAKDGERASLEYLALNESDGFTEVLEYGVPQLSAEAIVIKHGEPTFSNRAVGAARRRLSEAGYDPDQLAKL